METESSSQMINQLKLKQSEFGSELKYIKDNLQSIIGIIKEISERILPQRQKAPDSSTKLSQGLPTSPGNYLTPHLPEMSGPAQDSALAKQSKPVATWTTVAKSSKKSFIKKSTMPNSQAEYYQHLNRFHELQESIPAYRNMDYEQFVNKTQMKTNPAQKILTFNRMKNLPKKLNAEQIENVRLGKSPCPPSPMVTLHFTGATRTKITDLKLLFKSIGIRLNWIRNISFIGRSILELITFEERKAIIISKLEKYKIIFDEKYDPLSTNNLKNEKKYGNLSEEQKIKVATSLYTKRLEKTLERLPKEGIHNRLKNFVQLRIRQSKKPQLVISAEQPGNPCPAQPLIPKDQPGSQNPAQLSGMQESSRLQHELFNQTQNPDTLLLSQISNNSIIHQPKRTSKRTTEKNSHIRSSGIPTKRQALDHSDSPFSNTSIYNSANTMTSDSDIDLFTK